MDIPAEYKVALGVVTTLLALVCYVPYYYGILYGKVRPHLYTYVVWTLVSAIAVAGSWMAGGGPSVWGSALATVLCLGIIPLCLWYGYGTQDFHVTDGWFFGLALVAIVPWVLTDDPTWSVVLASAIEFVGAVPTYRKTWNAPESESVSSWGINTLRHALSIPAIASVSLATLIYPLVMVAMNGALAGVILWRRRRV